MTALATLTKPTSLTSDAAGNVYAVYGEQSQAIARVSAHGVVQPVIGRPNAPLERAGYFGGVAIDATTCGIGDVYAAADGRLWFTEPEADSLRVVQTNGVVATPISPVPLHFSTESCPAAKLWTPSILSNPRGLSATSDGRVAVASRGSSAVLLWNDAAGSYTTMPTYSYAPDEIAARGDDTFFFSEWNSVNRIGGNCAGPCNVFNFRHQYGTDGDNWPAMEAHAMDITGLTALPGDTLLLTDPDARRVRRIGPLNDRIVQTVVGGGSGGLGSDQRAIQLTAPYDAEPIAAGLVVSERTTDRLLLVDKTTLTGGPPEITSQRTWTLGVDSWYSGPTFSCRLDGGAWAPCGATVEVAPVADGAHLLEARATDAEGTDPTPAEVRWTLDTAPPEPFAATAPAGAAAVLGKPTLRWDAAADATSGLARYDVVVDGAVAEQVAPGSCTAACSWQPGTALADGEHTWRVRAVDRAGHVTETAARTFVIDTVAPKAFALASPAAGGYVTQVPATLSWIAAADTSSVSYEATLDETPLNPTGALSLDVASLSEGEHRWTVEAVDAAGNRTAAAERRFVVDTHAPGTIVTGGPGGAWANLASTTFGVSSDDPTARFECALDGVPVVPCGSETVLSGLTAQEHRFRAVAVDPAGNRAAQPKEVRWAVDLSPPPAPALVTPAAGAAGVAADAALRFDTGGDAGSGIARHEVFLDGARVMVLAARDCAGSQCTVRPPQLAHGGHTWRVVSSDLAGNTAEALATFSVDALAPRGQQTVTPRAGERLRNTRPELTWTDAADDGTGVARYEVSLDGGSPREVSGRRLAPEAALRDGPHTWSVVAVDRTGNRSAPAGGSFTVDTTAPQAALRKPPRVVAGLNVTYDASGSTDPDGGSIVLFEFDVDGDGWFEQRGPDETASRVMSTPGSTTVRVRVTDEVGLTSEAEAVSEVEPPTPNSAQPVGVSINRAAFATRRRDVELAVRPPLRSGAAFMVFSNDGTPAPDAERIPLREQERVTHPWLLDRDASKATRIVYVFFFAHSGRQISHADDSIVYDPTAPAIEHASIVARRPRSVRIRVRARDRASGLRYVQASGVRGGRVRKYVRGKPASSSAVLSVRPRRARRITVTVVDHAGNRTSRTLRP